MGNGDDGQRALKLVDGVHDGVLRLLVQRAGGLVQYQHLGPVIQRARQPDALALAARKSHAAFAHGGVPSGRQFAFNEVQYLRRLGRFAKRGWVNLAGRHAERNVLGHRSVEQIDVLRHVTDDGAPGSKISRCQGMVINANPALLRKVQAQDDVHERGFSAAGCAYDADTLVLRDFQRKAFQHGMFGAGIAEVEIVQTNRPLKREPPLTRPSVFTPFRRDRSDTLGEGRGEGNLRKFSFDLVHRVAHGGYLRELAVEELYRR